MDKYTHNAKFMVQNSLSLAEDLSLFVQFSGEVTSPGKENVLQLLEKITSNLTVAQKTLEKSMKADKEKHKRITALAEIIGS